MSRWFLTTVTALACLTLLAPAQSAPAAASSGGSGHRIVFQADPNGDGLTEVYTITAGATTPMVVAEDAKNPSISRSGVIYYTRFITPMWGHITKIYAYPWPAGPEEGVTRNELANEYDPCISRDNMVLAFTSERYFQPPVGPQTSAIELLGYRRPFVDQRQLTRTRYIESDPAVDTTGTWIYATVPLPDHREVWRFGYPEGKSERIAGIEEGVLTDCYQPTVDGQNRWCAYASERDGNSEIYIRDLATMEETRLTTDDGWDGEPAMSEDGSQIVFVSDRDGDRELFLMKRDGSGLEQLTENDWDDEDPAMQ